MRFAAVMSGTGITLYIKHVTFSIQTVDDNVEYRRRLKGKSKHYITLGLFLL